MMRKLIQTLGNTTTGVLLGFGSVLVFALGSFVMNLDIRLYPPFFPHDLNFFFNPPLLIHFWLYLLIVILFLFGGSLLFHIADTILNCWQTKTISPGSFGILLIHLSVVLGLLAHLHEGFYSRTDYLSIKSEDSLIEGLGFVRVTNLEQTAHPDGSLKDTIVKLAVRMNDGSTIDKTISYNHPALFDFGTKELLIQDGYYFPEKIILGEPGDEREYTLGENQIAQMKNGTLFLISIRSMRDGTPIALFEWEENSGERERKVIVLNDSRKEPGVLVFKKRTFVIRQILNEPVLNAVYRYNPSLPIVVIALLILLPGIILWFLRQRNYNRVFN